MTEATKREKLARPENRRHASRKRRSDIAGSKWPIVTRNAYNATLTLGVNAEVHKANPKIAHLCMGRIRLGQAVLAVGKAMTEMNPQRKGGNPDDIEVYNALRSLDKLLGDALADYPLEIRP